jgi:hypothetical protein
VHPLNDCCRCAGSFQTRYHGDKNGAWRLRSRGYGQARRDHRQQQKDQSLYESHVILDGLALGDVMHPWVFDDQMA